MNGMRKEDQIGCVQKKAIGVGGRKQVRRSREDGRRVTGHGNDTRFHYVEYTANVCVLDNSQVLEVFRCFS